MNITLESYSGSGQSTSDEVLMLKKALEAGYTAGSGASSDNLKVQSLEKTLKNVQYKEQNLAFWMTIPKLPAFSTVEEYNQLVDYGQETGGFFTEGDRPESIDASYARKAELVKYIGITKQVTHQAQLVSTNVGDMQMHAAMTGTRWVLRKADRALSFGNATVVPEEFNGLPTLHRNSYASFTTWNASENVKDLRGVRLTENDLEDGSEIIVNNYGLGNLFLTSSSVLSGFTKQYRDAKFIQPNTNAVTDAVMGQRVRQFQSQYEAVEMKFDVFMRQQPRTTADGATSPKAPAAVTSPSGVAATDTTSQFLTDYDGDYFYAVAAVNKYGESALTAVSGSLISIASNQALDIDFTAGVGAYAATGYIIYRSELNPTTTLAATNLYPVLSVSVAEKAAGFDGGAAGKIRDRNMTIANTFTGILIENDLEIWSFKQLAPLMRMDLARNGTADQFMVLLYGTPQLYMPKKMVFYKNIGRRAS